MWIAEEANFYGVQIKIIWSDGFQVDIRDINFDSFHVVAYYGIASDEWKMTKCITQNGCLAFKKKASRKAKCEDSAIPPLNVLTYLVHLAMKQLEMLLRMTIQIATRNTDEDLIPVETTKVQV